MAISMRVIKFCAEECRKQQSGEMSVYWMCGAFHLASMFYDDYSGVRNKMIPDLIDKLGRIVEPDKNNHGFRVIPVIVPGPKQPPHHSLVEDQVRKLCSSSKGMSPLEFYKAFEEIHPFVDGNGRVGAILYNFLNDTLSCPVAPPDVFSQEYVKKQS
jgi:hypothetical protein